MIVAYNHKSVIYAYKGVLNRNIDHDWSGAILMVLTRITDRCSYNNNVQPNPVNIWVPGIALNKHTAYSYYGGDGTIKGNIMNLADYRWHQCSYG